MGFSSGRTLALRSAWRKEEGIKLNYENKAIKVLGSVIVLCLMEIRYNTFVDSVYI